MARTVSLNSVNFSVPEAGETGYDTLLSNYLVALATAFPQVGNSATQALTAEWDAGTSFGPKFQYVKSQTANPASAGFGRLARTDSIKWRNQVNSGDVDLSVDSANNLTFNANYVTGNPFLDAWTTAGQSIPNNTLTIVVFGTVNTDSDAAYNNGTGRYTVPAGKGGDYIITATVTFNAATGAAPNAGIYKNAAQFRLAASVLANQQWFTMAGIARLVAGDIIDVRVTQNSGGAVVLAANATENVFNLKRIPT